MRKYVERGSMSGEDSKSTAHGTMQRERVERRKKGSVKLERGMTPLERLERETEGRERVERGMTCPGR